MDEQAVLIDKSICGLLDTTTKLQADYPDMRGKITPIAGYGTTIKRQLSTYQTTVKRQLEANTRDIASLMRSNKFLQESVQSLLSEVQWSRNEINVLHAKIDTLQDQDVIKESQISALGETVSKLLTEC